MHSMEALICDVLRGERAPWPAARGEDFADALLDKAQYHGVLALLDERRAHMVGWPPTLLETLRRCSRADAMWEMRHQIVLAQLHDALVARDVYPIAIKGTGLAYSLYRSPFLRARGDTDLFIAPDERSKAEEVLEGLGFLRDMGVSGAYVSYQASYTLTVDDRSAHTIDLHWKINNSELLSRLFSYNELLDRATKIPRLCGKALTAGPVDALMLACMHRATHKVAPYYVDGKAHYSGDRLIWLYDIHLLAQSFTDAMWQDFLRLATAKGLCEACLDGLEGARTFFRANLPHYVSVTLKEAAGVELASKYLRCGSLRQKWMNFCSLGSAGQKLAFLREMIFPPPPYMRWKYADARFNFLPWLYLRRSVMGGVKWLNPRRQS